MSGKPTDGSFDLYYRKGWAYLVVHPPREGGKPVYPEDVEGRMHLLEIPRVSGRKIRQLIDNASGIPEQLIEWPEGKRLASGFDVEITEDRMKASILIHPPKKGAALPTVDEVEDALAEEGITYGIDRTAIEEILGKHSFGVMKEAARGREPIHGKPTRIEYHFNITRGKPYLEMDFGRINLKELNFIENVRTGELLAELLDPVHPIDGKTVTGETIPAETDTRDVSLLAGKNTAIDSSGKRIHAQCDGNARLENGTITVEEVVTVKNVNYETGNIHFDGSVVITGSVADGFTVEAGGNIQVDHGVGKAVLKAGGNILLKTGINGNSAGVIECRGDLYAKYIESSSVTCRGHVFIEEAIMHSRVVVWKNCIFNGKRSEFMAGTLICGGSFWCKKLGSIYESRTHVSAGVAPEKLLSQLELKQKADEKQEQLNGIEEKIDQLNRAIKSGSQDERVHETIRHLHQASKQLSHELAAARHDAAAEKGNLKADPGVMVVVEETIHKGVIVSFGNLEYRPPDNGARKTILRPGQREVIESGFNYREKPVIAFDESAGDSTPSV